MDSGKLQSEYRTITTTYQGSFGDTKYASLTEGAGLYIKAQIHIMDKGYVICAFDTMVDVTKYNYLAFVMANTNTQDPTYGVPKIFVGLSNDKISTSFTDYYQINNTASATEYILDISEVKGEKYFKVAYTRAGYTGDATLTTVKFKQKK